jgi:hypothetical protein
MMEFKSVASKGQVYGNVTIKHMRFFSSLSCNEISVLFVKLVSCGHMV